MCSWSMYFEHENGHSNSFDWEKNGINHKLCAATADEEKSISKLMWCWLCIENIWVINQCVSLIHFNT